MLVLFLFLTQVGTLIARLSKDAILSQLLKLDQTQQDQAVSMTQKIHHLAFGSICCFKLTCQVNGI